MSKIAREYEDGVTLIIVVALLVWTFAPHFCRGLVAAAAQMLKVHGGG